MIRENLIEFAPLDSLEMGKLVIDVATINAPLARDAVFGRDLSLHSFDKHTVLKTTRIKLSA